jgi:hypothetical protein
MLISLDLRLSVSSPVDIYDMDLSSHIDLKDDLCSLISLLSSDIMLDSNSTPLEKHS